MGLLARLLLQPLQAKMGRNGLAHQLFSKLLVRGFARQCPCPCTLLFAEMLNLIERLDHKQLAPLDDD